MADDSGEYNPRLGLRALLCLFFVLSIFYLNILYFLYVVIFSPTIAATLYYGFWRELPRFWGASAVMNFCTGGFTFTYIYFNDTGSLTEVPYIEILIVTYVASLILFGLPYRLRRWRGET